MRNGGGDHADPAEQRLVTPKTVLQVGSDEIFVAEGVPNGHARIWPNRIWPKTAVGQN